MVGLKCLGQPGLGALVAGRVQSGDGLNFARNLAEEGVDCCL